MQIRRWSFLVLLMLVGCSGLSINKDPIETSDEIAEKFSFEIAGLYPELGSSLGYEKFDSLGTIITDDFDKKERAILIKYKNRIDDLLKNVTSRELKVDLLILKDRISEGITILDLEEKYKVLPFGEVSKTLFKNLFSLLAPGMPHKRKLAAIERFKIYVEPPGDAPPYPLAYMEYFNRKVQDYSGAHYYPYKPSVEKYLKDSELYIGAIGKLLSEVETEDKSWEPYFQKFVMYMQAYDDFVEKRILPYSRKSPAMPLEIYQTLLKAQGVELSPAKLIKIGKSEFDSLYTHFNKLGKELASKYKLKTQSGAGVIAYFKKNKIKSAKQAEDLYTDASKKLEKIIVKHQLVDLPKKDLRIRIASLAESSANPVPHLDIPPLKNHGDQRAEFVIPIDAKGELPFDDFSYEHAAMALTAHEGRPGHDLQFSYILDHPISTIRARYAQNATNVEGWALYAEDLVMPYISSEEQLVAIQTRLWRVARYFLDPMIHVQKGTEKDVLKTMDMIGVSKHMASLEFNRYAFEDPGQATGYYHGLLEIKALKKRLAIQGTLDEKCFNNTLISLGLIPFKYIPLIQDRFDKCLKGVK